MTRRLYLGVSLALLVALSGGCGDPEDGLSPPVSSLTQHGTVAPFPKLLASDGAAYDQFAYAVSVSGDTALVGAMYDDDRGMNSGSVYVFSRAGSGWSEQQKLTASDGAMADSFGSSVSVSGQVALIGASGSDHRATNAGSAYVFARSGTTWSEQQKITAADGATNDMLGHAVSAMGSTALVSAHFDDDRGSGSGSVYVFERAGTTWSQKQKLTASDGGVDHYFGFSVALDTDAALVGAYWDDDRGIESGSAYLFERVGTTWSQQQKFTAFDGATKDNFGNAVSISGNSVLVAARYDDDRGTDSGSAYVFTRTGTAWSLEQKITAPDGEANDYFGISAGLAGGQAVMGAQGDDDHGASSGSAYVFARSGTAWSQRNKLTASDGEAKENFGNMVALSGGTVLVGARADDDKGTYSGSAYLFSLCQNTTLVNSALETKVTGHNAGAGAHFGTSVSVSGNTAVVGAPDRSQGAGWGFIYSRSGTGWTYVRNIVPNDGAITDQHSFSVSLSKVTAMFGAYNDDDRGKDSGSAYIWTRNGTQWSQQAKLTASDGAAGDRLGRAVSVSGDTALAGAYRAYARGLSSGTAYIFTRGGSAWSQQGKLTASDGKGGDYFGYAASVSGDTALVGAYTSDPKGGSSGSAYIFTRSGTAWSQQAKLTAKDGAHSDSFGWSVSVSDTTALVGAYEDDDRGKNSGSAYLFSRSGTKWTEQTKFTAGDGVASDNFGWAVAVDGDTSMVGSLNHDYAASDSGAVYFFKGSIVCDKLASNGSSCSAGGQCDSGHCVDGVCCDTACGGVVDDCQACSTSTGAAVNGTCKVLAAGATCRASAGGCDVSETCDGSSTVCPGDGWRPASFTCRSATGPCDQEEKCTGSSALCPTDGLKTSGATCRASAGACDLVETCSGSSALCPADGHKASGTTCRAVAGPCDLQETCSGSSALCPTDQFKVASTTCRVASGLCDKAETCTGISAACPGDGFKSSGATCRLPAGPCDQTETCSGSSSACPGDGYKLSGAICRAAAGACDQAETCKGSSTACPADIGKPNGASCLNGSGQCQGGTCMLFPDAGVPDQGIPDVGTPDVGVPDKSIPDVGTPDVGVPDKSIPDVSVPDMSNPDQGIPDVGAPDKGKPDMGKPDVGVPDQGSSDKGTPDAGAPDVGSPDQGTADKGSPDRGAPDKGSPDVGLQGDGPLTPGAEGEAGGGETGCSCDTSGDPGSMPGGVLLFCAVLAFARRRRTS